MNAIWAYTLGEVTAVVLVGFGVWLGRRVHIASDQKKNNDFYCGFISTVPGNTSDPWEFQAEPCMNYASVIIGGRTLCEDHLETYITDMLKHQEE